jgi:hypothetical protein
MYICSSKKLATHFAHQQHLHQHPVYKKYMQTYTEEECVFSFIFSFHFLFQSSSKYTASPLSQVSFNGLIDVATLTKKEVDVLFEKLVVCYGAKCVSNVFVSFLCLERHEFIIR